MIAGLTLVLVERHGRNNFLADAMARSPGDKRQRLAGCINDVLSGIFGGQPWVVNAGMFSQPDAGSRFLSDE